ncbi:hypothetical protein ABFS82_14G224000 [Erythranthe guttata]
MGGDGGNGGGGDRLDDQSDVVVVAPPKSPWKTSSTAYSAVRADSDAWPALSDVRHRTKDDVNAQSNSPKLPLQPSKFGADGCGAPPAAPPPVPCEQQKFHERGNTKSFRRPHNMHQNKTGPKHGPNGVPPYLVPVHCYQQPGTPYFRPMFPFRPVAVPGYSYKVPPRPFLRPDGQLVNPGSDSAQAFVPPANGGFRPPAHADSSARDPRYTGRRPGAEGQNGQFNSSWNNQRPIAFNNFHMQQDIGPRPFISPPAFIPSGFVDVSNFQGPPGAMHYPPPPPPGYVKVTYPPFLVPHPFNLGVPPPVSPTTALRARIVKQIEYYFSDKNLQGDHYLISLMDDQGWVPISIIAGFKMIRRLNVEIPFILDSLQVSETIEVQGEKVRRRNEWSKWIPVSLVSKSSSHVRDAVNNDDSNENKRDNKETMKLPPSNGSSVVPTLSSADIVKGSINYDTEQSEDKVLACGEAQKVTLGNSNSSMGLGFQPDDGNDSTKHYDESIFPAVAQGAGTVTSIVPVNHESKEMQVCSDQHVKNLDDLSNDSSNIMLDEELEVEQKRIENDHPSSLERVDDENEEMLSKDESVKRLVIVTQNSGLNGCPGEESKTVSRDLASALNDSVHIYEQELHSKQSESRNKNSRYSANVAVAENLRSAHSNGRSSCGGSGNSNSDRKPNKGSSKLNSIHKQGLFCGNIRAHLSDRNSLGALSESPPSDAVGFSFGSKSPDSDGSGDSEFSSSPHLPSDHLIHKLLDNNGFEQQLYEKFEECCLSEREKLGIGCSEEMNILYGFWCYYLRDVFTPSMYDKFQKLAVEDAAASYYYGQECLFWFYRYSLERNFREDVYEDFEQLALDFYKKGDLYGLQKYWSFHHHRELNDKSGVQLKRHAELDRLLKEEYRCSDDFIRVVI